MEINREEMTLSLTIEAEGQITLDQIINGLEILIQGTQHPKCQIFQRRGHTTANCFYRNSQLPATTFTTKYQICGKIRHIALECYHMEITHTKVLDLHNLYKQLSMQINKYH